MVTKKSKILLILLMMLLLTLGYSQQRIAYYRNYRDFIRDLSIVPSELSNSGFYKALYQNNKLVQLMQIDSSGVLARRTEYLYNNTGNLAEKLTYNSQGQLQAHYTYQPDSLPAVLLWKIMGRDWVPYSENYYTHTIYDSLGLATLKQVFYSNGELIGGVDYVYDTSGMLSKEVWFRGRPDSVIESYQFFYDPNDSIQTIEQYNARDELENRVQIKLKQ